MHPVASIFSAPYNRGCFSAGSHLFFALFLLLFETLSLVLDLWKSFGGGWLCSLSIRTFTFRLVKYFDSVRRFDSFPCRLLGSSLISFAVLDGSLVLGGSSFKTCRC
jgi:hypothetical protein